MHPLDLNGLKTYDLQSRPSKVFIDDLGRPPSPHTSIGDWIDTLPKPETRWPQQMPACWPE